MCMTEPLLELALDDVRLHGKDVARIIATRDGVKIVLEPYRAAFGVLGTRTERLYPFWNTTKLSG